MADLTPEDYERAATLADHRSELHAATAAGLVDHDQVRDAHSRLADEDAALAAKLRAKAQEPSGWQPIETAPKDGTRVLIYQPAGRWRSLGRWRVEHIDTGYWHRPGNPLKDGFWCLTVLVPMRPTHWMPLPAPPQGQQE